MLLSSSRRMERVALIKSWLMRFTAEHIGTLVSFILCGGWSLTQASLPAVNMPENSNIDIVHC